ncbi:hypothetical protein, partial [Streptomyces sp. NPDC059564]|uniref:hypothetical protein n=1 Tax=Streptomyces sp. NPDC059564 TaxID=3346865 RepID=UPI00368E2940
MSAPGGQAGVSEPDRPGRAPAASDLRLAGPAVAAWGAAAVALGVPAGWTAVGAGLAVAVAGVLLVAACCRPQPVWQVGTAAAAALL